MDDLPEHTTGEFLLRRTEVGRANLRSDLIGIWAYSFNQWDEAQAYKYLDELPGDRVSIQTGYVDLEECTAGRKS